MKNKTKLRTLVVTQTRPLKTTANTFSDTPKLDTTASFDDNKVET